MEEYVLYFGEALELEYLLKKQRINCRRLNSYTLLIINPCIEIICSISSDEKHVVGRKFNMVITDYDYLDNSNYRDYKNLLQTRCILDEVTNLQIDEFYQYVKENRRKLDV